MINLPTASGSLLDAYLCGRRVRQSRIANPVCPYSSEPHKSAWLSGVTGQGVSDGSDQMARTAFWDGASAFNSGKEASANPYQAGSREQAAWLDGFWTVGSNRKRKGK